MIRNRCHGLKRKGFPLRKLTTCGNFGAKEFGVRLGKQERFGEEDVSKGA